MTVPYTGSTVHQPNARVRDTEAVTKPCEPVPIGAIVTRIASGRTVFGIRASAIGGLTFLLGDGGDWEFVKVAPPHPEVDLQREAGE
jgi:kanamycin kinase